MNKETIDIIKRLVRDGHISQEVAEKYVPELKESKDEEIRNALISILKSDFEKDTTIHGISVGDIITWLEKSESVNHTLDEKAKIDSAFTRMMLTDEKKHIDRAKQKFKVSDWIINGDCVTRIIAVGSGLYVIGRKDGTEVALSSKYVEKWYRPWTIQDAKDGDVLYTPKGCGVEGIFLIEGWKQVDDTGRTLCSNIGYCVENDEIIAGGLGAIWWKGVIDPFYPATKEQHDLLFQKMHEAGYEWDSEKKELKKTEQKPVTIDIDKMVNDYANNKEPGNEEFGKPVGCMIRAYKQGLNDAIRKVGQKPAWSEEDEKIINGITSYLCTNDSCELDGFDKWYDFLKSLKDRVQPQSIAYYNPYKEVVKSIVEMCKHYDRLDVGSLQDFYDNVKVKCKDAKEYESLFPQNTWKPSEGQLEALEKECIAHSNYELCRLLEQLKKLKE